jgi:hypothetical protein
LLQRFDELPGFRLAGFMYEFIACWLAFAAPSTDSEAMVEDFMPIRIRHCNKNMVEAQQSDISAVRSETTLFSQASYTAIKAMFGVLYGSI